jgi:hypothetical protein
MDTKYRMMFLIPPICAAQILKEDPILLILYISSQLATNDIGKHNQLQEWLDD